MKIINARMSLIETSDLEANIFTKNINFKEFKKA